MFSSHHPPSASVKTSNTQTREFPTEMNLAAFFSFFFWSPRSQSALPVVFHPFPNRTAFVSKGWHGKPLQCSVKTLLYIYLFYSCLVFYSSPVYIKTNKLFLEMSSFSLGARKERRVIRSNLIQPFCIITSTPYRKPWNQINPKQQHSLIT